MQNAKWQQPFIFGLAIILAGFFFSFMKIQSRGELFAYDEVTPSVSVSATAWNMAWGSDLDLNLKNTSDLHRSERRELMRIQSFMTVPRVMGVYFLLMLFLVVWGVVLFFAYPELPVRQTRVIAISMAGLFILFFGVMIYEIIHYRNIFRRMGEDNFKLSDYVRFVPQIGCWLISAGIVVLFAGAFTNLRSRLPVARPSAFQP